MWKNNQRIYVFCLLSILLLHACNNEQVEKAPKKGWVLAAGGNIGGHIFVSEEELPQSWSYSGRITYYENPNCYPNEEKIVVYGDYWESDRYIVGAHFSEPYRQNRGLPIQHIFKLIYHDRQWLAIDDYGYAYANNKGVQNIWRQISPSYCLGLDSAYPINIAYGANGHWVAIRGSGEISASKNLMLPVEEWEETGDTGIDRVFYAVEYGNGNWVAVGGGGAIVTTRDLSAPIGWRTPSSLPTLPNTTPLTDVAYDGKNTWVAICGENKGRLDSAQYATNQAQDNILAAHNPAGAWSISHSSTEKCAYFRIKYAGAHWVVVGRNGMILTTTDPASGWSLALDSGTSSDLFDVEYGNGHWVAVGDNVILTTQNPQGRWKKIDSIPTAADFGFAYTYLLKFTSVEYTGD